MLTLFANGTLSRTSFMRLVFVLLMVEIPQVYLAELPSRYRQDRETFLPNIREFQPFAEILRARPTSPSGS